MPQPKVPPAPTPPEEENEKPATKTYEVKSTGDMHYARQTVMVGEDEYNEGDTVELTEHQAKSLQAAGVKLGEKS